MLLGNTYMGNPQDINPAASIINVSKITLSGAVFDTLKLCNSADYEYAPAIRPESDNNTVLLSKFNGTLATNDIEFQLGKTNNFIIKRREQRDSTTKYTVIGKVPSREIVYNEAANTYHFTFSDRTSGFHTTYEYSVCAVSDNVEGAAFTKSISSEFNGLVLTGPDNENRIVTYATQLEPSATQQINIKTNLITTLGSPYPFSFSSKASNYRSGTAKGLFLPSSEDVYDLETACRYQEDFFQFLTNGKPKLLKLYDGRKWLVVVHDNVDIDCSEHDEKAIISFNWTEIGDSEDYNTLVDFGIIPPELSTD